MLQQDLIWQWRSPSIWTKWCWYQPSSIDFTGRVREERPIPTISDTPFVRSSHPDAVCFLADISSIFNRAKNTKDDIDWPEGLQCRRWIGPNNCEVSNRKLWSWYDWVKALRLKFRNHGLGVEVSNESFEIDMVEWKLWGWGFRMKALKLILLSEGLGVDVSNWRLWSWYC